MFPVTTTSFMNLRGIQHTLQFHTARFLIALLAFVAFSFNWVNADEDDQNSLRYISLLDLFSRQDYAQVVSQVESMSIQDVPAATELQSIYLGAEALYALENLKRSQQFFLFWQANTSRTENEKLIALRPYVDLRLAQIDLKTGKEPAARDKLQKLSTEKLPGSLQASVWLQMAWLEATEGKDLILASQYCEKCLAAAEQGSYDQLSARLLQGVIAKKSNDIVGAAEILDGVRIASHAIKKSSDLHFKANVLLLQIYNDQSQSQLALPLVDELQELEAPTAHLQAMADLQTGLALLGAGKSSEAIPKLESLLEPETDNEIKLVAAGTLIRLPDEYVTRKRKIEWCKQILATADLKAEVESETTVRYARLLATTGESEQAIALLKNVADANDMTDAWCYAASVLLAETFYQNEKFDEAVELFQRLIASEEMDKASEAYCLALLRIAEVSALRSNWTDADELLREIVSLPSKFQYSAAIDYLQARVALAKGEFDAARSFAAQAVKIAKQGDAEIAARAQWLIGETYFLQKRYKEALEAYESVLAFDSQPQWCSIAMLQSGKCHELLGNWQAAVDIYDKLLLAFPQTIYAEQAKERLVLAKDILGGELRVADADDSQAAR